MYKMIKDQKKRGEIPSEIKKKDNKKCREVEENVNWATEANLLFHMKVAKAADYILNK